jgi:hypothetical protein
MPYDIRKVNNEFCVVKESDGEVIACHSTREGAANQIAAIEANEDYKTLFEALLTQEKADSYKPSGGMVTEARKGLEWRSEFGRGGTAVGIARARDIVNGKSLSADTVKRMYSFFSRHEVDKRAEGFRPGEDGYPSNGRIAWALWGGDAGFSWSRRITNSLKTQEEILEILTKHAEELE